MVSGWLDVRCLGQAGHYVGLTWDGEVLCPRFGRVRVGDVGEAAREILRRGWLGPAAVTAKSASLKVMVGGVSQREPVYCVAPRGLAGFGARYTVLIQRAPYCLRLSPKVISILSSCLCDPTSFLSWK